MKNFTVFVLMIFMASSLWAQNDTIQAVDPLEEENENVSFETPDKTEIKIGEDELFIIKENGDTTSIQLGSKGLSVIEGEDGYTIDVMDMEENEENEDGDAPEQNHRKSKFKPHFSGFEIGLNNFLNPDNTMLNQGFMNLNTSKSWNYNINFLEYGIGLGTSYAGLVTGMGLEWSNYVFDGNNSIQEDVNGNIVSWDDPYPNITKSKLTTTYLNAPLLLEFQIPAGKKRIHISGGVIGGVKLASKTKIKYYDGGKQKDVRKNDYSLSPFRYGAHVRIGYRSINLFATYYFSPLFGEVASPELNPFSVGLTLIPF